MRRPVPLIDVHAHLHGEEFDADRDAVLARARQAGVRAVLLVGEDVEDNRRVLEVAEESPELFPCLGLHPDRFADPRCDQVIEQIDRYGDRLVAVGEVGLDYWRALEEDDRRVQREVLVRLAEVARRWDVPLNVHSRSAGHHTLELLDGEPRVHMHAFDGKASYAVAAAEKGVFFSLPPSLLRSPQKQKLARRLPVSQILLESDAPVLGPNGAERNEPKNLALTLQAVAELRGMQVEELEGIVEENTLRAYPRLQGLSL